MAISAVLKPCQVLLTFQGFSEDVTNKLSNLTDVAKKRHQLEQRVCADEALLASFGYCFLLCSVAMCPYLAGCPGPVNIRTISLSSQCALCVHVVQ